jgi:hypothetical protein
MFPERSGRHTGVRRDPLCYHPAFQIPAWTMKNTIVFSMLAALALSGCNRPESAGTASVAAPTTAPATPANRGGALSADQLAKVTSSGKIGLWSDVTEVCANRHKRAPIMLAWNVQATGTKKVAVYLLDKTGHERRVAQGDAIGGRIVGRWVHPGSTFVLRDAGDAKELSRLVIGTKSC